MSEPTKTYAGILNQIAFITFGYMCACIWLLCQWAPRLKDAGGPLIEVDALKLSIPGYWLGAIVVAAFVFRLIKLHDRISDLLGIRNRYDYMYIIRPLFEGSKPGAAFPEPKLLMERRRQIMRAVFYKYTKTEGADVIDGHFVEMVWESLRWLWVIVEAAVVTLFLVVLCLVLGEMQAALFFGLLLVFVALMYPVAKRYCIRQTTNEVREILGSPARSIAISEAFDEILH